MTDNFDPSIDEESKSTEIGDLTKLLQQGFLAEKYVFEGEAGRFEFKFRTLLPLEEIAAVRDADSRFEESSSKDPQAKNIYLAIETLARCIESVNGVPFEQVPGSDPKADTPLKQKRSLANQFSQRLLLELWNKHQELRSKMFPKGTPEEEQELKK